MKLKKYIEKILKMLFFRYSVRINMNPLYFDFFARWYDNRVPFFLIYEAVSNLLDRKRKFNIFILNYEVRKLYKGYLQLRVGASPEDLKCDTGEFKDNE